MCFYGAIFALESFAINANVQVGFESLSRHFLN